MDNPTDSMEPHERYAAMRKAMNMSVAELAFKLGTTQEIIYKREKGKAPFSGEVWLAIRAVRAVRIKELMDRAERLKQAELEDQKNDL